MNAKEYLADPCKASSLPFWKAETINIPEHMKVLRDDEFSNCKYDGFDDQYFRLIHDLKNLKEAVLPDRFELVQCEEKSFAEHINSCYEHEHMSIKEMLAYKSHPVYDPDLWVSVIESDSKKIVATGIAELDTRIGEGVLEWIQVSSDYRKLGLGKYIVCELLIRLENKADFVTVSGRVANKSNPYALYKSCGFVNPVIWHVVTTHGLLRQEVSYALLEIKETGDLEFKKVVINTREKEKKLPKNIDRIISKAMSLTDSGKTYQEIAKKLKISEELAESICRMYLTHPGVDVSGILQRIS